jgi:hypothetical protein
MVATEHWDDAHTKATEAREAYKNALRTVNYGI